MILIISVEDDWSTNDVIDWLVYKGADFKRINFDKLNQMSYSININNNHKNYLECEDMDYLNKTAIIWFRRSSNLGLQDITKESNIVKIINKSKYFEESFFIRAFFHTLNKYCNKWLNNYFTAKNDKFQTLLLAESLNLCVPNTILTTSKKELLKFMKIEENVIIKPIYNIEMLRQENDVFMPYTKELSIDDLKYLDINMSPVLVQRKIEKLYEVRSFYLNGQFYSMAIFSQLSEKTKVDFRKYDTKKPNRRIPYQLPQEIEKQLNKLMHALDLNSGSIDLIYGDDNKYYFLEVNPVGQFGMVSYPCNYYLEEKIAEYLILNDNLN